MKCLLFSIIITLFLSGWEVSYNKKTKEYHVFLIKDEDGLGDLTAILLTNSKISIDIARFDHKTPFFIVVKKISVMAKQDGNLIIMEGFPKRGCLNKHSCSIEIIGSSRLKFIDLLKKNKPITITFEKGSDRFVVFDVSTIGFKEAFQKSGLKTVDSWNFVVSRPF